jgi:multiple sugar transport system substrate-binding protein
LESLFLNGRLGMYLDSRKVVPAFRTITGFGWDVAPLPTLGDPATILHSDGYCITAGSEQPDQAWDFIEFAIGEQAQEIGAQTGRAVPSLISAAESDAFLDPSRSPSRSQVFLDQLPGAGRIPVLPNWVEVEDTVDQILEESFFEGAATEEVLEEIDRQTAPLLAEG